MRNVKKIIAAALACALTCSLAMPPVQAASKKTGKKVVSVTITKPDTNVLVLKKKKKYKLTTKVGTIGKISKKVTYKSSNKKVVKVSSKGQLTAVKNGTAKITVKSKANKKKKDVLTVKVGTPITKISLNQSSIVGKEGTTQSLTAVVSPKKATVKKVSFRSSNKEVATVDAKGKVNLLKKGTAVITATAMDGNGKTAVCNVVVEENAGGNEPVNPQPQPETPEKPQPETPQPETPETPKDSYKLVWKDEFEGDSLNTEDWNYEYHEPGWVNSELQEYVDSEENIFLKDGALVIKAVKTVDDEGKVHYTSGRINTQKKHDFKYGKFEAKVKVPEGQGFLPAFWMMPTDENLYGQWPKCGEIDIMEVMGQNNKKVYGTIHYGEPHRESQGTHILTEGNYSDDYHVFSCEWEPGKIRWYVDGVMYHEESDWYSAKAGQGTVSYPAPFDQPFYLILNLAVGGSWVGNPDETTSFDNAALVVDYVKVYQKDESEYDENVKKPEKEVILRDPDANGNYVINGDFAVAENLEDEENWAFMTALGGEAQVAIADNAIRITTGSEGTVDYSVQLVQAGLPFEKGATYEVSFDAMASESRTMKTSIKAPDYGYAEYMSSKTVELGTDKQSYSYEFKMTNDSDANGRLEFNMGAAGSIADICISNVKIKKIKAADPNEVEEKSILADGNHVYNGGFQEGEGRLGYWEITNNAEAQIMVTNINADRRLKVTVDREGTKAEDVLVKQSGLAMAGEMKYALSFEAQADAPKNMRIMVAGQELEAELTKDTKTYEFKIITEQGLTNKDIVFYMGEKGTIYLDNIRLVEDTLIKNGSFDAGFAGYEWYADSSADATHVVDSLNESNAADFTIKNTGDQDWKIQMKQNNINLIKGTWYKLSFKAKSSLDRKIRVIMQGGEDKDWAVYSGENTVSLTSEYQTFDKTFQMTADTDPQAFLSICLGAVDGDQITQQHRVCIDDISLEEVEAPELPEMPAGENLLKNGDFANGEEYWEKAITAPGEAEAVFAEQKAVFNISNVGTADWNVQLKQAGITLEEGCSYTVSLKASSTASRTIKLAMLSSSYAYYGGQDISLEAGEEQDISFTFTMDEMTDTAVTMVISMGKIEEQETPVSDITLSDISLVKNAE